MTLRAASSPEWMLPQPQPPIPQDEPFDDLDVPGAPGNYAHFAELGRAARLPRLRTLRWTVLLVASPGLRTPVATATAATDRPAVAHQRPSATRCATEGFHQGTRLHGMGIPHAVPSGPTPRLAGQGKRLPQV